MDEQAGEPKAMRLAIGERELSRWKELGKQMAQRDLIRSAKYLATFVRPWSLVLGLTSQLSSETVRLTDGGTQQGRTDRPLMAQSGTKYELGSFDSPKLNSTRTASATLAYVPLSSAGLQVESISGPSGVWPAS